MNVDILGHSYDVETTRNLYLGHRNLTSLPPEIGNLTNLQILYLHNNSLTTLPAEIGNLTNLQYLYLHNNNLTTLPAKIGNLTKLQLLYLSNNNLTSLPVEILNIKDKLVIDKVAIDETSYEIDNMDPDAEFIVLSNLTKEICNLPITLKEIWLKEGIDVSLIKVPFGCEIKYFTICYF